jgi:hypothetical protein
MAKFVSKLIGLSLLAIAVLLVLSVITELINTL